VRPAFVASTACLLALTGNRAVAQSSPDEFFKTRIRPVLTTRCYGCHSSKLAAPKGDLALDTKAGLVKGGKLGPAIVPGNPSGSRLFQALRYTDPHLQMPPTGKLADSIIADFEQWITAGAPDPRVDTVASTGLPADLSAEAVTARAGPGRRIVDEKELAKGRQWWAFQPVRELAVPSHVEAGATRTKLDHFVLAKLQENGLTPSDEADPPTLVRRAYLDLIGLKPR
jgi:hypothetical protein